MTDTVMTWLAIASMTGLAVTAFVPDAPRYGVCVAAATFGTAILTPFGRMARVSVILVGLLLMGLGYFISQ